MSKKNKNKLPDFIKKNKTTVLFVLIVLFAISLRIITMHGNFPFGWDQVDNAWAAQKIIANHETLLNGMVAKGNSGLFIGPAYYYFVVLFYLITNLNPIASEYVSIVTTIFTFTCIFYVCRKLFSDKVALVAVFINAVSFYSFYFDIVQWPVNFIPGLSLLIFYFLVKVLYGEQKYLIGLAVAVGLMFNIHFTAVFFPIIILLTLPFFPWNKKIIKYILISIPVFVIWFIPSIISQIINPSGGNFANYFSTYYHGVHLRRFLQLAKDGLIQFDPYLYFPFIKILKFILIPAFLVLYLFKNFDRKRIAFAYVLLLFFLIPWFVFATYRGEISDYYFCANRFLALIIISYLLVKISQIKGLATIAVVTFALCVYSYFNIIKIVNYKDTGLEHRIKNTKETMNRGEKINFQEGVPESYIYYYIMRQKGVEVY